MNSAEMNAPKAALALAASFWSACDKVDMKNPFKFFGSVLVSSLAYQLHYYYLDMLSSDDKIKLLGEAAPPKRNPRHTLHRQKISKSETHNAIETSGGATSREVSEGFVFAFEQALGPYKTEANQAAKVSKEALDIFTLALTAKELGHRSAMHFNTVLDQVFGKANNIIRLKAREIMHSINPPSIRFARAAATDTTRGPLFYHTRYLVELAELLLREEITDWVKLVVEIQERGHLAVMKGEKDNSSKEKLALKILGIFRGSEDMINNFILEHTRLFDWSKEEPPTVFQEISELRIEKVMGQIFSRYLLRVL